VRSTTDDNIAIVFGFGVIRSARQQLLGHREESRAPTVLEMRDERALPQSHTGLLDVSFGPAAAKSKRVRAPQPPSRNMVMAGWRTVTLSRKGPRFPAVVVAGYAVVWAVLAGLFVSWCLTAVSSVETSALPVAKQVWLASHHVVVSTQSGDITLLPLGLLLVSILPLCRAGRYIAAQVPNRESAKLLAGGAACCYALAVIAVAMSTAGQPVSSPAVSAGCWGLTLAVMAGGWGFSREGRMKSRVPIAVWGAGWAIVVPLILGAMLTVAMFIGGFGAIQASQSQLAATGFEQVALVLLQLLYLPNLVVWAGAYVIGTGFSLGGDQVVSPFANATAALPELPLFAAMPTTSARWTALLPLLVVAGGIAAAMLVDRRIPERRLGSRIGRVLVLALAVGFAWFVMSAMAGGSLGDGRLDYLGPAAGTALAAAGLVAAGGALWALLPTMAADAKPVAQDLRTRVGKKASETRPQRQRA